MDGSRYWHSSNEKGTYGTRTNMRRVHTSFQLAETVHGRQDVLLLMASMGGQWDSGYSPALDLPFLFLSFTVMVG